MRYHAGTPIYARGEDSIVKHVALGSEAIEYLREELAHPDPLADALRRMPLEAGHITVYAPSGASAEDVRNLRAVLPGPSEEGMEVFKAELEFIFRYLQQGGSRALVMGSYPAKPSEWCVMNLPRLGGLREWAERLTCEGLVYFFATEASDRKRVRDVFDDVQAMTTFGMLASNLSWTPTPHHNLVRGQLDDLVRHTDHVLVGAYDNTSELIWSKQ